MEDQADNHDSDELVEVVDREVPTSGTPDEMDRKVIHKDCTYLDKVIRDGRATSTSVLVEEVVRAFPSSV